MSLLGREYLSVALREDPPGPGDARVARAPRAPGPFRRRPSMSTNRRETHRDDLVGAGRDTASE